MQLQKNYVMQFLNNTKKEVGNDLANITINYIYYCEDR